ncbi:MAG: bifunctional [glutamate--ammonia ligase]-adenylyl-L-tyrosine phosphorylase/[glutamate--ammonia-ligase] adenylyltransferase, partial [Pseudomonadota bacterium]|nr:bifunctional [glutamate--ammonia ligase]-adenylyl-L-tyrosine phosphorylase/[glutamate--ammonia-ligase] adenylyltransferase [Pseudomonadota bacterium]
MVKQTGGGQEAAYSRFVQRIRRRYEAELPLLPSGAPDAAGITRLVAHLQQARGYDLAGALRVARHLVVERLAVLDVEQAASLDTVTHCMTALAEATLELALTAAQAEADVRHGAPIGADGKRLDLWIVGMGKLGARELNVSSDIDLIYVYEEDGQTDGATDGARPVSFHEYFVFVAKRLYALIGETTDDGIVFRVDLALRPHGNSGAPVVSLAMLENYLQAQGREWERFAWLKSRVVAPRAVVENGRALALRSLVTPFVYRRYLDYGVFEGLRQLHRKVREAAQRRAAGRPERANDVKLSRGGIREIEFIVQLMLVVRGGQFPEIRTRSTLRALKRLVERGLMADDTARELADSYVFLRQIEHRIQYLDDQQTHLLPSSDEDLSWIARSLGFPGQPGAPGLLQRLGEVRERVAGEFDALLREGRGQSSGDSKNGRAATDGALPASACRTCGPGPLPVDSLALADRLPAALAERVRPWAQSPRVQALRDQGRLRLGRLLQKTASVLEAGDCSEAAALRFVDWLDSLMRRESYLALLLERPEVLQRMLRVLGMARWPMQYLMRHPGVIDELADQRLLQQRFDRAAFDAELADRRAAWQRAGEDDDEEQLLDTLRRAHHAEVFRILVRDVEGAITTEQVADDLSALADAVLDTALRWCWTRLKQAQPKFQAHSGPPALAVIAYGKLGGKELGYGSDLDLVFVYDERSADGDAQEIYAALVRKLITWLTLNTAAGSLFEIDTALRPNGNSGLLVTSIDAFDRYQVGRGSNTAWSWEHQALTRARGAAGDAA